MKKKTTLTISLLTIFLSLLFLPSVKLEGAEEIREKKKDLRTLQKKIKESEKKKLQAEKKEKEVSRDLRKTSREVKSRTKELAIYDWNLKKNERERKAADNSLEKLKGRRGRIESSLGEEIRMDFKKDLLPQLAASPAVLAQSAIEGKLKEIVDSRFISFLEKINKEITAWEFQKEKLEKYRNLELAYKKAAEAKKKKAASIHKKQKKVLSQYQKEKSRQEGTIKELTAQAQALEGLIKRIETEQRSAFSFRGGNFRKRKGKLSLPVEGKVAKARYGNSSDIYKGILIIAPQGREVITVAPGKVLYGEWFRGFGNIIIIDHGEGYSSLYAHLDKIFVRTGQKLEAGEVIAAVGKSGTLTTEPRLYFELRHYGEPLDPLGWLNR